MLFNQCGRVLILVVGFLSRIRYVTTLPLTPTDFRLCPELSILSHNPWNRWSSHRVPFYVKWILYGALSSNFNPGKGTLYSPPLRNTAKSSFAVLPSFIEIISKPLQDPNTILRASPNCTSGWVFALLAVGICPVRSSPCSIVLCKDHCVDLAFSFVVLVLLLLFFFCSCSRWWWWWWWWWWWRRGPLLPHLQDFSLKEGQCGV